MVEARQHSQARWYARSTEEIGREFGVVPAQGLAEDDATRRLSVHGRNELPEAASPSPWRMLGAQFSSLIIWVLIGAALVSGLLGEWVDAGAILAIVLLNGLLGFVQEYRAEQSLAALKTMSVTYARVIRAGTRRTLSSTELVPGDIIDVEAGDHVPADARLIQAAAFRTQEAALTGESTPVEKPAWPWTTTMCPWPINGTCCSWARRLPGARGAPLSSPPAAQLSWDALRR